MIDTEELGRINDVKGSATARVAWLAQPCHPVRVAALMQACADDATRWRA